MGITQLSDLLEIKTIVLKKDKLKAEKRKLAVFFEQLEHCSARNSKGDFLYSSTGNKSNFSIKDVYLEKIYLKSLPTLEMWGFFNLEMQIELLCCCDSIKCCIYAYS